MSEAYSSSAPDRAADGWTKPLPSIDQWNRRFWDATAGRRFVVQRDEHGNTWFPPSPVSPFDIHADWEWVEIAGRGKVLSWVVFHQKYFAGFANDVPYNVALVELDEGPVLFTNLHGIANDAIEIGMAVKVDFLSATDTLAIPVFRPAEGDRA